MDNKIATINNDERLAFVSYLDQETGNVLAQDQLTGEVGQQIEYQSQDKITELQQKGYLLVYNGFNSVNYAKDDQRNQVFAIILKHAREIIPYNLAKQYKIDSTPDEYLKERQLTLNIVDNDGQILHDALTQKVTWTKSFILDKATRHVVVKEDSDWVSEETDYSAVSLPVLQGYYTDQASFPTQPVTDQNIEKDVTYHALGKIIPIQPNGQSIPGAEPIQYQNDPNDPTKVPAQKLPQYDGFVTNQETITPSDPGQNTYAVYIPVKKDN